jgi:hypothetical protein
MRLAETIHHQSSRIVAHSGRAQLVDALSRRTQIPTDRANPDAAGNNNLRETE